MSISIVPSPKSNRTIVPPNGVQAHKPRVTPATDSRPESELGWMLVVATSVLVVVAWGVISLLGHNQLSLAKKSVESKKKELQRIQKQVSDLNQMAVVDYSDIAKFAKVRGMQKLSDPSKQIVLKFKKQPVQSAYLITK